MMAHKRKLKDKHHADGPSAEVDPVSSIQAKKISGFEDVSSSTHDRRSDQGDLPPHLVASSSTTAIGTETSKRKRPKPLDITPILPTLEPPSPAKALDARTTSPPSSESTTPRAKKRKRKADVDAETDTVMPDVAANDTWCTPTGTLLTFSNAGNHLTHWAQAIGHNLSFGITDIPASPTNGSASSSPSKRSMKRALHDPLAQPRPPPLEILRACTLTLPVVGTVRSTGLGWRNKVLAKRSASFMAVRRLHTLREVDDDLRPTPSAPKPKIPSGSEDRSKTFQALLARKTAIEDRLPPKSPQNDQGFTGMAEYPLLGSPRFWSTCPPFRPDNLHATILTLETETANKDAALCRPLCLITTKPIPLLEHNAVFDIPLTVGNPEVRAIMRIRDGGTFKRITEKQLGQALRFTQRLMRAHLQKPISADLTNIKWLVAPLKSSFKSEIDSADGAKRLGRRDIAWDEVIAVADGPLTVPFDFVNRQALEQQCKDAMTSTPVEYSRRFYVTAIRDDLNPSSPHPDGTGKTISQSLAQSQVTPPSIAYPGQPILEAEMVNPVKNGGYIISAASNGDRGKSQYLIPELTQRHCIPASVFRTSSALPAFFHYLDDMLGAEEMNRCIFGATLNIPLALQATTPTAAVTLSSGNYERLEILGDTLLKLVTTLHAYTTERDGARAIEQTLEDRHVMCSNRTLQANAVKVGLAPYIHTKRFRAKDWMPRDWKLDWSEFGDQSNQAVAKVSPATNQAMVETHRLGDKVLADVVEALIAAAYLPRKDLNDVIATMHRLLIPIKGLNAWSDLACAASPATTLKAQKKVEGFMKAFRPTTSQVLGYTFQDDARGMESLAMTGDRKKVYDRYKMLGDALYDYFLLEHLWTTYPDEGPASLTNMKAVRVSEGARSALAVHLGLVDKLCDGDDQTRRQMAKIQRALSGAKAKIDAASASASAEGDGLAMEYWSDIAVSHLISDLPEALLGAILHDSAFDLAVTRKVYERHYHPFLERYCRGPHAQDSHPKSQLARLMQSAGCSMWGVEKIFKGEEREEAIVMIHSTPVGRARGATPALAVRAACAEALKVLKSDGNKKLRELCTCTTSTPQSALKDTDDKTILG